MLDRYWHRRGENAIRTAAQGHISVPVDWLLACLPLRLPVGPHWHRRWAHGAFDICVGARWPAPGFTGAIRAAATSPLSSTLFLPPHRHRGRAHVILILIRAGSRRAFWCAVAPHGHRGRPGVIHDHFRDWRWGAILTRLRARRGCTFASIWAGCVRS